MKRHLGFIGLVVLCLLLFSGCGPSEAEIAAMTADAWTPTPHPTAMPTLTPTATPVPFGLTLLVVGEEEIPVSGAQITLVELETDEGIKVTDDMGMVSWSNLPGETVTFAVSAQGYIPSESSEVIDRGDNQLEITLQRDPYGLVPSEACAPGESLLYVEDFQDGHAQGWPDIEFRAAGWDIDSNPDTPENFVARHAPISNSWAAMENSYFENAVFRFQFFSTGGRIITIHWHIAPEPYSEDGEQIEDSRYQIDFLPSFYIVTRHTLPVASILLAQTDYDYLVGSWHNIEISTFEDVFEIWIDGKIVFHYEDPQPIPFGGLMIEASHDISTVDPNAIAYFDNFTVCELTGPFISFSSSESFAADAAIPADQGPIAVGNNQIEVHAATVWEGMAIREGNIIRGDGGTLIFPITPETNANSLIVIMNLLQGNLESFADLTCEVIEPDENRILIENIQESLGQVIWLVPVSSSDTNLMVSCTDGVLIDLTPVLSEN